MIEVVDGQRQLRVVNESLLKSDHLYSQQTARFRFRCDLALGGTNRGSTQCRT